MNKFHLSLLTLLILSQRLLAQTTPADCTGLRYSEAIFSNVDVDLFVKYGDGPTPTFLFPNLTQPLYLDIYQPDGDPEAKRPLIIWAFGGAFVAGTSLSPDIVELSNRFARLGYVNASIDYRLSPDLVWDNSNSNAYEAVKKAMQDMKAAIRFFYKDAQTDDTYRIDTTRIYVGGVSAGGITAVHVAYLDELSEVPSEILQDVMTEGGLEGMSGNPGYGSAVKAVINLSGGILDTAWINAGDVPIVSVHGDADEVVPYGDDAISLLGLNLGFNGSATLHERMDELGIANELHTFQGAGHTPFVSDGGDMDITFATVRDFLYTQTCPSPTTSLEEPEDRPATLFPNPTKTWATLRTSSAWPANCELQAFDLHGKTLRIPHQIRGHEMTLDASALPNGIYALRVTHQGGLLWQGRWSVLR